MSSVDVLPIDGRRARRERGRLAVLDAMVDLVLEGHSPPTTEAIAERAGVSVASLFRYFPTLEDLQQQTTERFLERYDGLLGVPDIGVGSFAARIQRYVSARCTLYETVGPMARFARDRSRQRPQLATSLILIRHRHADITRRHFAEELVRSTPNTRDDEIAVITSLTSFESWEMFHNELGRSRSQIVRAWTTTITRLLS